MIKGEPVERERTDFVPTRIMALSKCGKITPTYWIPGKPGTLDGGGWSGFDRGELPLLWAAWPNAEELMKAYEAQKAGDTVIAVEDDE